MYIYVCVCTDNNYVCVCFHLLSALCPFRLRVETDTCLCIPYPKLEYQRDAFIVWTCFKLCLALHNDMFLIHMSRSESLIILILVFTELSLGRSGRSPDWTSNSFTTCRVSGPAKSHNLSAVAHSKNVKSGTSCTASATSHAWRPRLPWDHRWQI